MRSCVIILNWNGWNDTIECLESVFRLKCPEVRVLVCDNGSANESLSQIKKWANGELPAPCANPQLSRLSLPPFPKPIPYIELTRDEAAAGSMRSDVPLILIQNGANLGFAAGNNVGVRYALQDPDCEFFWLLNNDTVAEPDALSAMIRLMEQNPRMGICGSLNLSYYDPTHVQVEGGYPYSRWTARVPRSPERTVDQLNGPPRPMDYVHGASMLVRRAFLEEVGLMEESYFIYFEELDWAMRAKGKFTLGYARESVIYHKEGASIGTHGIRSRRSLLADQYLSRNRVLFTRRFLPWAVPSVVASVFAAAAYRLVIGDPARAKAMFSFMLRGITEDIPTKAG